MSVNYGTFLRLFKGREDYFAEQHDNAYRPIRNPLDDFYVAQHLSGDATFGIYLLTSASCCHLLCIDIDVPKSGLAEIDFRDPAKKHAILGPKVCKVTEALRDALGIPERAILFEETGGRGYHIWVFLDGAVSGRDAVAFGRVLKEKIGFEIEFFPKQGQLSDKLKLGNLIKLPLGVHKKYGSQSRFFCIKGEQPLFSEGIDANLKRLDEVIPAKCEVVLSVAKECGKVPMFAVTTDETRRNTDTPRPQFDGEPIFLVSGCAAMGALRSKAEKGEKFSRSEAFHFANVMLCLPSGRDYILDTMRRSYGADFSGEITEKELNRIHPLHPTSCATLRRQGVCPRYCRDGVRHRNEDPLLPDTTPCAVWLPGRRLGAKPNSYNLLQRIGDPLNVTSAYFRLREYHEHEDSLFFDIFDYESFERSLHANREIIATALREKVAISFAGYIPVMTPKKLNGERQLEYRKMAYSSVHDQVPIQAVFDVIAPVIEEAFQETSYGYRWNTDERKSLRIFEDWREAYPRFRARVLGALRANPKGYHICCDIKGYYDHIDHAILCEQLRPIVPDDHMFQFVKNVVSMYRHDDNEAQGVPQGPAYARLLANLYLNDFDVSAASVASGYFRYVDDIFLFFENEADAVRGLDWVVRELQKLGLKLAENEEKKARVTNNTDESQIWRSLEKIQYGILEGTRHIRHLDHTTVSDFYDAVERHHAFPATLEALLRMNEALPSLLYVATQELLIPHPLRPRLFAIIKFLVEHHWFCPKRLKSVLFRLLDIAPNEDALLSIFEAMEGVHKVYVMLSIHRAYRSRGKHRDLLERIVEKGFRDEDGFVTGFAASIATELGLGTKLGITDVAYISRLRGIKSHFTPAKWLDTVNYLMLSPDERQATRELVTPASAALLRAKLFHGLRGDVVTYLDFKYLANVSQDADVALIPPACSLLAEITNKTDWLNELIRLVTADPRLKASVVALLAMNLFDKRVHAGLAEVQNLKALYETLVDPEIKRILLETLTRISSYGVESGEDFARCHRQVQSYNECFLFERTEVGGGYEFLEVMPTSRLKQYVHNDVGMIRRLIEDLADKAVLPPLDFVYDSGRQEVDLRFRYRTRFKLLVRTDYTLRPESILRALSLAAEAYKKACYFRRMAGKSPLISINNLLVDADSNSIVFRTFGRCLQSPYVLRSTAISDEEYDLPKMVGALVEDLLFDNDAAVDKYIKEEHDGVEAFLAHFIRNLSRADPSLRYSYSRFQYLLTALSAAARESMNHVRALYLRERMKGELFRRNPERTTWQGVCGAVSEHVRHFRQICGKHSIHCIPYRNQLAFKLGSMRSLHRVSQELLNLAMNLRMRPEGAGTSYIELIDPLLQFSVICLETVCFDRGVVCRPASEVLPLESVLSGEEVSIRAAGYERVYRSADFAIASSRYAKSERPSATDLSLQQLALRVLLSCDVSWVNDHVTVERNRGISEEEFRALAHACLMRIPNIENKIGALVSRVNDALRNGEDGSITGYQADFISDIEVLAADFRRLRRRLHLCRRHGVGDGRYFPPDVVCRWGLGRKRIAKESALPGIPLTSKFPASKYDSSWDIQEKEVVTLVIPDEGLKCLLVDLKSGKLFWRRLSYMYCGRSELVWDSIALVLLLALLGLCEYGKNAFVNGVGKVFCGVGSLLTGAAVLSILAKIFLRDLTSWIRGWSRWTSPFRKKSSFDA